MKSAAWARVEKIEEGSAPTRGPWIEMTMEKRDGYISLVGPHTGAVD